MGSDAVKTKKDLCTGRKRYNSRASASRAAEQNEGWREYRCPFCPGFHVTTKGIGGRK